MEADAQNRNPPSEAWRRQIRADAVRATCIDGGAGLALLPHRCLTLGSRYSRCDACVRACPAGLLRVGAAGFDAAPGCLGCGRCQAACPTAALRVAAFPEELAVAQERYRAVTLDCARVPPGEREPGTLAVPCLGGLSLGALLELCAQADPLPVTLLDRGWCSGCPAGGGTHPAAGRLLQAADYLREAGLPSAQLPRLQSRPLAANLARRAGADAATGPTVSRRGFFRSLPARAISVAASRDAAARGPVRAETAAPRLPSVERERVLAALGALAARHGGRLPAALFHRLDVGPGCEGHRVCAAVCPTGALRGYRESSGEAAGLAYDTALCIGCGRCAHACPEQAMTLACGGGAPDKGLRALARFETRSCAMCGGELAARAGDREDLCDRCSKSSRLAHAGFQQLFGARRMAGDQ